MPSAIVRGRARSDLDVMSRAGLPLHEFLEEAALALQRAVPFVAGCLATLDPATSLVSGVSKVGALRGRNEQDIAWAQIEYGVAEPTALATMVESGDVAVGLHHALGGDIERSVRMADLMVPVFDFHDEARVVFRDRAGAWGAFAVFRDSDDAPFDAVELAFLAETASAFTRGIRAGLLVQMSRGERSAVHGPAVVIVDAKDRIVQLTPSATEQLARLGSLPDTADPLTFVYSVVNSARRFARGQSDRVPRTRIRTRDGGWLVVHASPLTGPGDRGGDVVVTIEEARPQEVVELVAAAFGLTARERDVTGMVLRGADTKEIAAAMHVSPYTVQDHLKSIFDKAGVASRRELVARVYFDQYAPRIGESVGADGWFTG
jgi:DNA-binding CsgD family transcriptional regulator